MSKPFRFKLEKVLEFRRQAEDQAKMALAKAKERLDAERRALDSLLREREEKEKAFAAVKSLSAADLWLWRRFRERLKLDMERVQGRIRNFESEVERARAELVTRAKERKLLDKLKEQQAVRHAKEAQALEQKSYDEVSTILFGHQNI
ncbi:flagellar export protein FliJ [Desulfovibrio sp. X2]|uniref:flagellar export protein FliJ n=1 Tax=Desulfovibrio sp. X2 TaxID=941449 RepID=UPI00035896D2|nr:flagellar export protein FliJ [Desulfovibrio sp. X2]EPR43923.1 flagellar export protein FliJ [Desulfovibrio sp. X2]